MQYEVTAAEVQKLASKLDELSQVLTESERALLLHVFSLAQKELAKALKMPGTGGTKSNLPSLSEAFKAAFVPGKAAGFESDAEEIKVSGGGEGQIGGNVKVKIK